MHFLFRARGPGTLSFLLLALVHIGVGFWLVSQPLLGTLAITIILCSWFLAQVGARPCRFTFVNSPFKRFKRCHFSNG